MSTWLRKAIEKSKWSADEKAGIYNKEYFLNKIINGLLEYFGATNTHYELLEELLRK